MTHLTLETAVLQAFGVTPAQLHSRDRRDRTVQARFALVHLMKASGATSDEIAGYTGRKNDNVFATLIAVRDRMDVDKQFRDRVSALEAMIGINQQRTLNEMTDMNPKTQTACPKGF